MQIRPLLPVGHFPLTFFFRHSSESWNLIFKYLQTKIPDQVRDDTKKNDGGEQGVVTLNIIVR